MTDEKDGKAAGKSGESLFMSVSEFAEMLGVGYETALAACKSESGPPLVKSGRNHLVYRPTALSWAQDAAMSRMQL